MQLSFETLLGAFGLLVFIIALTWFRRKQKKYKQRLDDSNMNACEGYHNQDVHIFNPNYGRKDKQQEK